MFNVRRASESEQVGVSCPARDGDKQRVSRFFVIRECSTDIQGNRAFIPKIRVTKISRPALTPWTISVSKHS